MKKLLSFNLRGSNPFPNRALSDKTIDYTTNTFRLTNSKDNQQSQNVIGLNENPDEAAAIIWREIERGSLSTTYNSIKFQIYSPKGKPKFDSPINIYTPTTLGNHAQVMPNLVKLKNGNIVTAFRYKEYLGFQTKIKIINTEGQTLYYNTIDSYNLYSGRIKLATFKDNKIAVIWSNYNGGISYIILNDNAIVFQNSQFLNTYKLDDYAEVATASLSSSKVVVAWPGSQDSKHYMYYQLINPDGSLEFATERPANTNSLKKTGQLSIGANDEGFYYTWCAGRSTNSPDQCYLQTFSPNGTAMLSEETQIDSSSSLPSLAAFPNKDSLITWEQDSSRYMSIFSFDGKQVSKSYPIKSYERETVAAVSKNEVLLSWQNYNNHLKGYYLSRNYSSKNSNSSSSIVWIPFLIAGLSVGFACFCICLCCYGCRKKNSAKVGENTPSGGSVRKNPYTSSDSNRHPKNSSQHSSNPTTAETPHSQKPNNSYGGASSGHDSDDEKVNSSPYNDPYSNPDSYNNNEISKPEERPDEAYNPPYQEDPPISGGGGWNLDFTSFESPYSQLGCDNNFGFGNGDNGDCDGGGD